jgi:HD-like signal output (HDOD) protein
MGESLIDKALRREVITTFGDPDYRPPPLPSIAIQLVGISRNEEVELEEVVRLLEQDPVLAGIAMRLVSSSLYAGRSPVSSLHQAVVRIGLKKLRSIVFEATLRSGMFDLPEYRDIAEQVSRHGTASAYLTRLVCETCKLDPENGFLCGLLHDVGFSALLLSVTHAKNRDGRALSALWEDIDGLHEQATGIVVRLWGLPREIADVVGRHHHPERCPTEDAAKVAAAVCVADALTERLGASIVRSPGGEHRSADRTAETTLASAREALRLDDASLATIIQRAEETLPEILGVAERSPA